MSVRLYRVSIEGMGLAGALGSPIQYVFTTIYPVGYDDRHILGLQVRGALETEIDLLTGEVANSVLTFALAHTPQIDALFGYTYTAPAARALTSLSTSGPTVNILLDDSSAIAVGAVVYWDREAFHVIANDIGLGQLTCTRAVLGTSTEPHTYNEGNNAIYARTPFFRGRRVTFTEVVLGGAATVRFVGIIDSIRRPAGYDRIEIGCVSAGRWLDTTIGRGRWSGFSPRDGNNTITYATEQAGAEMPVLEYLGIATSDGDRWVVLRQDDIYLTAMRDGGGTRAYSFVHDFLSDHQIADIADNKVCEEVLSTWPTLPTFNPFRRRVVSTGLLESQPTVNPIDIALILMLSGFGGANYNPAGTYSYDILPIHWGARIPRTLVDVGAFEALRLELFPDARADQATITAGPLREQLVQLLWPLGVVLAIGSAGLLRPVMITDVSTTPIALDIGQILEVDSSIDHNLDGAIESAKIMWRDVEDEVWSAQHAAWYPDSSGEDVEVDASFYRRDDADTAQRIVQTQIAIVDRFLFPPPVMRCTANTIAVAGDHVSLTHTPAAGAVASQWFVLAATFRPEDAATDLTLIRLAHDLGRTGPIAGAVRVVSVDITEMLITIEQSQWALTGTDDSSFFEVGDQLLLCSPIGEHLSSDTVRVVTASATLLEIDNPFDARVMPEYLIVGVDYSLQDTGEEDRQHYLDEDYEYF